MRRFGIPAALAALLLLASAGCTPPEAPASAPPASAAPAQPGPAGTGGVRTDWSKLTPYQPEEPIYTRRYPDFTATLLPAPDYGPLVPFLGDALGGNSYDGARYGLVTLSGEVVVDPVFSDVWRGDSSAGYHSAAPLPYLMLELGVSTSSRDEWPEGGKWAMAAPDGSWCTDFKYGMDGELTIWGRDINANATESGLFVTDGDALVYLDGASGEELLRVEDIPPDSLYDALFSARWEDGGAVYHVYDYAAQGTDDYYQYYRADASGTVRLTGAAAELERWGNRDGKALRATEDGAMELFDASGETLLRTDDLLAYRAAGNGGQYLEYRDYQDERGYWLDVLAVYDAATLERVEDSPLPGRRVQCALAEGWSWCREGEDLLFFLDGETVRLTWPEDPAGLMWGRVVLFPSEQGDVLVTLDGEVLLRGATYGDHALTFDRVTGEPYLRIRRDRELCFYDESGALAAAFDAAPSETGELADGLLLVRGADCSGLRDAAGNWLFRWPLPTGEWD